VHAANRNVPNASRTHSLSMPVLGPPPAVRGASLSPSISSIVSRAGGRHGHIDADAGWRQTAHHHYAGLRAYTDKDRNLV